MKTKPAPRYEGVKMATVTANAIEIAYELAGPEDGSPILLTRGLGTQLIDWPTTFVRGLLDGGFRVLRYDNRDAGLSQKFGPCEVPDLETPSQSPYSLFDMADDAVGLLDELGIERAHILGISMGGMISQIVAARHPGRSASLISIMSSAGQSDPLSGPAQALEALREPWPPPPIARPSSPGASATGGCSAAERTRQVRALCAIRRSPRWNVAIAREGSSANARRFRPPDRARRCCAASPYRRWSSTATRTL